MKRLGARPARRLLLAVLVVAALVAGASPVAAEPPPTTQPLFDPGWDFGGTVTNSGGTPVPCLVELYIVQGGPGLAFVDDTITDASGFYSFVNSNGAGNYYLKFSRAPGYLTKWVGPVQLLNPPGWLNVSPTMSADTPQVERLADTDRFSTAVRIAREHFADPEDPTKWHAVNHIVIASGEDRAAADPLAAAGLCGWYRAPLFLVTSDSVPSKVKQAIKQITDMNTKVTIHIVGGPVSVPDARYDEIVSYVGGAHEVEKDRILSTGGRFEMAAAIADRITASYNPDWVLVANGADPAKFFDALALSPISAYTGYPILLVGADTVPSATQNALSGLGDPDIVVGGGPATVSQSVAADLNDLNGKGSVERWSGSDRYATAAQIATKAKQRNMLKDEVSGVAAKLPDALTGGGMMGLSGGALLVSSGDSLSAAPAGFIGSNKADILKCYVLGGEKSVTPTVKTQIENTLK
jgi:putative cell wall-binding protein